MFHVFNKFIQLILIGTHSRYDVHYVCILIEDLIDLYLFQDGEARVRVEIHPVGVTDKHNNIEDSINSLADQGISPAEASPVKNFLSGKNCLHGVGMALLHSDRILQLYFI